jgi:hypothetical protein
MNVARPPVDGNLSFFSPVVAKWFTYGLLSLECTGNCVAALQ